jgi:hypothetical protein
MGVHKKNIKKLEQFEKKINANPKPESQQTLGNPGKPRPAK